MTPTYEALLLDIGDVIMSSLWRGLDAFEAATGIVVPERGPYDPDNDPDWQRRIAGEIGFYDYWEIVAQRAGFSDWRALFRGVSDAVPDALVVQESVELMRAAKRAGKRVGVLSNDAYSINGPEYFAGRAEFRDLDAFVDSTEVGARKPAPEPYLAAAKALGVDPSVVVFLDDTPECVEGARAVGMFGIHVDPMDVQPAIDLASEALGLVPESRARRLVRLAEEAYGAQDLEAIMRLFHPDAIVYWDGVKVASGFDEVRRFHVERLGFGEVSRRDYVLTKTLRAAQGDTVAVEWQSRYRSADGSMRAARAAELWTLRGDQLVEWHAYYHRVEPDA
ncbi:MAG TPA: HAD-IA family hydrolase [Acidimicrobiales bacterium]|nr:HAD-IA family hydrolase [Acidimicrobiales bacterium]